MLKFKDKLGEEITLRPWEDKDIDDLIEITNHAWIVDNLKSNYSNPMTRKEAQDFINGCNDSNGTKVAFAIELDGRAIGNICVAQQEGIYRKSAELTFWLSDKYWNRGISSGSVRMIVPYAFDNLPVVRIYSEPYSRNIGSKIVLSRSGFKCDGVLRSCVFKSGVIADISVYSILSTEIKGIK